MTKGEVRTGFWNSVCTLRILCTQGACQNGRKRFIFAKVQNTFGECWKYSKASLNGFGLKRENGLVKFTWRGDLISVLRLPLCMLIIRI